MTDEQRDEVTRRFKNAAKENNRSLPLVLKEKFGKLDLGQNLTDMKIIESSDSGITALCSVYGLPPELMGYGQKTYNNLNTARKSAWTDCIMPLLSVIEDTFNECLIWNVPEHAGLQFKFDYSEIEELQEGLETRVGWMRGARWTGNEIRVSTGKQPIDDPAMDEPIIPMGEGFLSDFTQPIEQTVKSFEDYK
jgi:phage portal protein BeeE